MVLKCLGSGSSGNCYILQADSGEKLIIECGLPFREIKRGLGYNLHGVVGCLVSHRHSDHSKALHDVVKAGIRVLAIEDVFVALDVKYRTLCKTIQSMRGYVIGGFRILVLEVAHDVPCVGFIIEHVEMGKLLFVTDTMMLEWQLPPLDHIMLECNYSDATLQRNIDSGLVPAVMRERLMRSHMELQTAKGVLTENDITQVKEIILIHLSGNNANAELFKSEIGKVAGKPVYIAERGFEIFLSKEPY